jgi:hypothetical protein
LLALNRYGALGRLAWGHNPPNKLTRQDKIEAAKEEGGPLRARSGFAAVTIGLLRQFRPGLATKVMPKFQDVLRDGRRTLDRVGVVAKSARCASYRALATLSGMSVSFPHSASSARPVASAASSKRKTGSAVKLFMGMRPSDWNSGANCSVSSCSRSQ